MSKIGDRERMAAFEWLELVRLGLRIEDPSDIEDLIVRDALDRLACTAIPPDQLRIVVPVFDDSELLHVRDSFVSPPEIRKLSFVRDSPTSPWRYDG